MDATDTDDRKTFWSLRPHLDVSDLQPPAVMFSIFETDPRPRYQEILQISRTFSDPISVQGSPGADPLLVQQGRVTALWDSLFRDTPGNTIALLIPEAPVKKPASRVRGKRTRPHRKAATLISSNTAPGTKWLVTRASRCVNKTVAWCIPVNVVAGKRTVVRLTRKNMTVLVSR